MKHAQELIPKLLTPGAYDRLRNLQRARRRTRLLALALLLANAGALLWLTLQNDVGRYLSGA